MTWSWSLTWKTVVGDQLSVVCFFSHIKAYDSHMIHIQIIWFPLFKT